MKKFSLKKKDKPIKDGGKISKEKRTLAQSKCVNVFDNTDGGKGERSQPSQTETRPTPGSPVEGGNKITPLESVEDIAGENAKAGQPAVRVIIPPKKTRAEDGAEPIRGPTAKSYKEVPVNGFGLALLRGMGLKDKATENPGSSG